MIKVGIVGGTGYTGVELLRLLAAHPQVSLQVITSRADAGTLVSQMFPSLRGYVDLPFTHPDQLVQIDMVHAESGLIAKGTSFLNFDDRRSQNDVFREMAAVQDTTLTGTRATGSRHRPHRGAPMRVGFEPAPGSRGVGTRHVMPACTEES